MFRQPSNNRDWEPYQKVLATAERQGETITLHNIRDFSYRSIDDYDASYYDHTFDLGSLASVSLSIIPFTKNPFIAHILTIFAFTDGAEVIFSVEVRKRHGQKFVGWQTALNNYELMYVVGSRRDIIDLRNHHRENERVVEKRLELTEGQRQKLFIDFCTRLNHLAEYPEFFNLFFNSCSSNVINHLNKVLDTKIPWFYQYIAPRYLDRALIARGVLHTE